MSEAQPITPELRQWIIEQATAGQQPEAVLQSMIASGWNEDVAMTALEETLRGFLDERARVAQLPAPVPVPEPLPDAAALPATVWAGDREVRVLASLRNPRVIVFGGLLADDECDELMALAGRRLARSETVQTDTGASDNPSRLKPGSRSERGARRRVPSRSYVHAWYGHCSVSRQPVPSTTR